MKTKITAAVFTILFFIGCMTVVVGLLIGLFWLARLL